MADWLDEYRKKEQDELARVVAREQEEKAEREKELAREGRYLKNKAQIDAKISDIESYAYEVRRLTKADITTNIDRWNIHVKSSNIDGGINFSFQDKDVDVFFWQGGFDEYAGYSSYKDGRVKLNIDDITIKKINRWFQWLAQQGGKLPVTLKSDSDRKFNKGLIIFTVTVSIIALVLYIWLNR